MIDGGWLFELSLFLYNKTKKVGVMSEELYQARGRFEDAKKYWRYVRWEALPKIRPALSGAFSAAAYAVPSDTLKVVFAATAVVTGASAARDYFCRDQWGMSGWIWTKGAWNNLRESEQRLRSLDRDYS